MFKINARNACKMIIRTFTVNNSFHLYDAKTMFIQPILPPKRYILCLDIKTLITYFLN